MKKKINWNILKIVFGFIFFILWVLAVIAVPCYYCGWKAGILASIIILFTIITYFAD